MAVAGDGGGVPPFSKARTAGGLALLALAFILYAMDYSSTDFAVDSIQLGLIFGTSLALLGVEAWRKLLR